MFTATSKHDSNIIFVIAKWFKFEEKKFKQREFKNKDLLDSLKIWFLNLKNFLTICDQKVDESFKKILKKESKIV